MIFLQIIQSKIRKDQQNLCMHFRTNSLNGCTTFKHSVFSTNTCKSSAISITACKPTGLFNRDCEPTHKLKKSVRRPKPLSVIWAEAVLYHDTCWKTAVFARLNIYKTHTIAFDSIWLHLRILLHAEVEILIEPRSFEVSVSLSSAATHGFVTLLIKSGNNVQSHVNTLAVTHLLKLKSTRTLYLNEIDWKKGNSSVGFISVI